MSWDIKWGDNIEWNEGVSSDAHISEKIVKDKAMKRYNKNYEIHAIKARQLTDLCGRPKKGEQWRIITEKQFNAFNLIIDVLQKNFIEEVYIAIYRINEPTVEALQEMIASGRIKHATFILSNFFLQTKRPERWAQQLLLFCKDNPDKTSYAYVHNHAKVICIKDDVGNYYVFEGSGNMSDNARIEQYIYENDEQMFNFHKQWMNNLIKTKKQ